MNETESIKYCFSTLPCMDYNAKQLKALCEKYHIDGVEVRQKPDGSFVYEEGLSVVDVGTGICFLGYDPEMLRKGQELLHRIETTSILAIRIFLGNFCVWKTDAKRQIDYEGVVTAVRELADTTEKEIWIETHNEFATGRVLQKLLSDIGRKNVKVIWDIIHPIEDHEMPEETWNYIGDKIAHVHIKDGKVDPNPLKHDFEYTPLGEGQLPLREILGILQKNHYRGYLSLEWENLWRTELKKYDSSMDAILGSFLNLMKEISETSFLIQFKEPGKTV